MSVDTVKARRNAGSWFFVENTQVTTHIHMLCDEIDRLRKELAELEQEWDRSDKELAQLREQLRPRSIKDEPPPTCKNILVWSEQNRAWVNHHYLLGITASSRGDKCWMPEPPAPPQPDAFGEWAELVDPKMNLEEMRAARMGWDAAIQSTKGKV